MTLVVGVDGSRNGWTAVVLGDGGPRVLACASLAEVVERVADAEVIAVDIPIGLPVAGRRRADAEARAFVGPRWASVFWTPPRAALLAPTYREAVAACEAHGSPRLSQQAYGLRRRILEAEALAARDPRLREVHPEVSFRALASSPLSSKKTWNGLWQRRALLETQGIVLEQALGQAGECAPDDVLDAAVAAWSASRIARGAAATLPAAPEPDKARIWY